MASSKAAIYVRVSKKEGQNLENQRLVLQEVAARNGLELVRIYEDKASGSKARRTGIDEMRAAAEAGEWNVLLVWAIDRLGRSMIGTIDMVLRLDKLGIRIISHAEPWLDMVGPVRNLLLYIFSWVAEQERERLIERTHAGLATARLAGKQIGRKPLAPETIDRVLRLRKKGRSIKQIGEALGIAGSSVHKLLHSDDAPPGVLRKPGRPRGSTKTVAELTRQMIAQSNDSMDALVKPAVAAVAKGRVRK